MDIVEQGGYYKLVVNSVWNGKSEMDDFNLLNETGNLSYDQAIKTVLSSITYMYSLNNLK